MKMTLMQHFAELRRRILWTALIFVFAFGLGWLVAPYVELFLVKPLMNIWNAENALYIDVLKREVRSSVSGNILTKLSNYDDIENFYLAPGINKMEAVDLGEGDKARIMMEYQNYYVEAVY